MRKAIIPANGNLWPFQVGEVLQSKDTCEQSSQSDRLIKFVPKLRAAVEDDVQLLAEALSYSYGGLYGPYARGDELEQGARVDASGLGEHVCKHPSSTYMIKSA